MHTTTATNEKKQWQLCTVEKSYKEKQYRKKFMKKEYLYFIIAIKL